MRAITPSDGWLPGGSRRTPERIRGRRLQRLRAVHLGNQPLCVLCLAAGRTRIATQLDHILALTNGGGHEASNLQGLCDACHTDKTARDLGRAARVTTGLDGWPVEEGGAVKKSTA